MNNEVSRITEKVFQQSSLEQVPIEMLEKFVTDHPYAAPFRFLLARKKRMDAPGSLSDEAISASLYLHNPLWFQWQLDHAGIDNEPAAASPSESTEGNINQESGTKPSVLHQPVARDLDSPIVFQSYHTIDYFASQGIRLQQAELGKDKLGQQLKSFTEWLRSMKKLPAAEAATGTLPEDDTRQQLVARSAESSIQEKEILTEAMAEVWAKQGNREKAIATYHKLSLLNPAKSAYFAAKIEQLK